ncbi:hypothetical protein GN316_17850 [Xylophilus sp. Kf1]|nr:hypothetical protein [Xylophilus sp. Kf1]
MCVPAHMLQGDANPCRTSEKWPCPQKWRVLTTTTISIKINREELARNLPRHQRRPNRQRHRATGHQKMLYELSGTRLRIVGTLHLLPPGGHLPDWLAEAHDWSEAVFVEHSPQDFLTLAREIEAPLDTLVSPAFWQLLNGLVARTVLPWSLAEFQRGAAVVMALACRIQGIAGADQALHDWSRRDGKAFGYVEQPAAVLEKLQTISEADWTAGIQAEQARPETTAWQLQHFHDAWHAGRVEDIAANTREGLFSIDTIRAALLTGRNRAWARAYRPPARRSLMAVGAAHLAGEDNFLEALAEVSGRRVVRLA